MKAKSMSLALAAVALLSTTGAYAQVVEVQTAPVATVTTTDSGLLGTAASVVTAPVSVGANLMDSIFNPPGSLFELSVLGNGISVGGKKKVVQTEFARIIPGRVALGSARPVHAKVEGPKPMFHFDLFGGRLLEFGPDIAPSMDMRID